VCQDVCPWNRKSPPTRESLFFPREGSNPVDLCALFDLDESAFRRRFRDTPLWRPKRRGLLRNAAIVLGNQRFPAALPALAKGLIDSEPLVRGACAWALGRIETNEAIQLLQCRLAVETDIDVRQEIVTALGSEHSAPFTPLSELEL
jgi:epoxyqueuosine reductase